MFEVGYEFLQFQRRTIYPSILSALLFFVKTTFQLKHSAQSPLSYMQGSAIFTSARKKLPAC
jgi:hypothetical protein